MKTKKKLDVFVVNQIVSQTVKKSKLKELKDKENELLDYLVELDLLEDVNMFFISRKEVEAMIDRAFLLEKENFGKEKIDYTTSNKWDTLNNIFKFKEELKSKIKDGGK